MKHFPSLLQCIAFSTLLITLSACQTFEGIKQDISTIKLPGVDPTTQQASAAEPDNFLVDNDCPSIELVNELTLLSDFGENAEQTPDNLISGVVMRKEASSCEYGGRSVTVDLKLAFDGQLGPKGRSAGNDTPFFSYPFFVAVTSSSGKILAKEVFAASINYEGGQDRQTYYENLRQIIPVDSRSAGKNLKVMTGFQLTQEQLAFNRKLMREQQAALEQQQAQAQAAQQPANTQTTQQPQNVTQPDTLNNDGPIVITAP